MKLFHKLFVAAFIAFATFVAFANICTLLSPKNATALVSSRLDYCNSVYHNFVLKDILKLQSVQNCLARVVNRSPPFAHSVPLLKSLHSLIVPCRIIGEICTVTYQALSSKQPAYLHSLLTPARQARQLQSPNYNLHLFPVLRQMLELELV